MEWLALMVNNREESSNLSDTTLVWFAVSNRGGLSLLGIDSVLKSAKCCILALAEAQIAGTNE